MRIAILYVVLVYELSVRLEDITVVFLLPVFFLFTGLRSNIGLLHGAELWGYAAAVLVVAALGKFGGLRWPESSGPRSPFRTKHP